MKTNQSIERAMALLRAAGRHPGGATITALAADAGLPRPTASRLLATLEREGMVGRSGNDRYVLGYEIGRLARSVDADRRLSAELQPALEELAARCRETVTLAVPRPGPELLVLAQIEAPHMVRAQDWIGPWPLHATASGKVLLAELANDELDAVLSEPLERLASRTVVDPSQLRRELARVRAHGFAEILDELEDGLAAVAMGVRHRGGELAAVVSVTGPAARFAAPARAEAVEALSQTTARVLDGRQPAST
jgi:IclR family transcriptional regulator, acetate operon repressor